MPRLVNNRKGAMEGMPLELLVLVIVMALAIPATWNFAEMYVRNQTENELVGELDSLVKLIGIVGGGEIGNKRMIEMDLEGHPLARIDYVKIGGSPGESSYLRYRINGGQESLISLDGYHVSNFTRGTPSTLDISGGVNRVVISRNGRIYQGVEILDLSLIGGVDEK